MRILMALVGGEWKYGDDLARTVGVTVVGLHVAISRIRTQYGAEAIETARKGQRGIAKYRLSARVLAYVR